MARQRALGRRPRQNPRPALQAGDDPLPPHRLDSPSRQTRILFSPMDMTHRIFHEPTAPPPVRRFPRHRIRPIGDDTADKPYIANPAVIVMTTADRFRPAPIHHHVLADEQASRPRHSDARDRSTVSGPARRRSSRNKDRTREAASTRTGPNIRVCDPPGSPVLSVATESPACRRISARSGGGPPRRRTYAMKTDSTTGSVPADGRGGRGPARTSPEGTLTARGMTRVRAVSPRQVLRPVVPTRHEPPQLCPASSAAVDIGTSHHTIRLKLSKAIILRRSSHPPRRGPCRDREAVSRVTDVVRQGLAK
ncbi:hypothetical protein BJ992_002301 [Sphaerisporangium rubeum]|uniref:Uncharacterized protein n=1 Tax=Sphaerisporangium rubeum TaxID=321317 RepID=A0A7X0ID93_9ACTN|nr:hypothetical protein [Sphaerisporangium rubeum]